MERLQFDNIFEATTDDKAEAADLEFRADLLLVIRKIVDENDWSPSETATALGVTQPRISELMRGKISLFSSDKLIRFLSILGYRLKAQYQSDRQKPLQVKVTHHDTVA
jgi:predicted XRE-type DNA-binding protein